MPRIVPLPKQITSRKHARRVTSDYHRITERLHQAGSSKEKEECVAELEAMGGVDAYQKASVFNTSLHSTSRWVAKRLRARGVLSQGQREPRVLEIGAINTQLLMTPGLKVRAIDLNSQDALIVQQDFLQLPHGGDINAATGLSQTYDVLVCSMVLNCVPDARMRFDFLVSMRSQLAAGGLAFIVLPLSCVEHSRTLNHESFTDCLRAVGLAPDPSAEAPESSKLVYYECIAALPDEAAALRYQKTRHELRSKDATRRKSRGAEFDVDLGGHLGFGMRVSRSFEPTVLSRAAREQRAACQEFLAQQVEEGLAPAALPGAGAGDAAKEGQGGDAASDGVVQTAEDVLIDEVAKGFNGRLDFSDWRWQGAAGKASPGGWVFAPQGSAAATRPSLQAASGWQWAGGAWKHTTPRPVAEPASGAAAKEAAWQGTKPRGGVPAAGARLQRRQSGVRKTVGSPWSFTLLPRGLRTACWWLYA